MKPSSKLFAYLLSYRFAESLNKVATCHLTHFAAFLTSILYSDEISLRFYLSDEKYQVGVTIIGERLFLSQKKWYTWRNWHDADDVSLMNEREREKEKNHVNYRSRSVRRILDYRSRYVCLQYFQKPERDPERNQDAIEFREEIQTRSSSYDAFVQNPDDTAHAPGKPPGQAFIPRRCNTSAIRVWRRINAHEPDTYPRRRSNDTHSHL